MPYSTPPPTSSTEREGGGGPGWLGRAWRVVAPAWITRDMNLIISARVAMSITRALAGIVAPIYLAKLGYTGLALGLIFTVVALTSATMSSVVGILSDRVGRKVFLVAVPLLATLAALGFASTTATAVLVAGAALGSFGRGAGAGAGQIGPYQPAEQALLAGSVPHRWRTDLFGRVAFASSLGALIGGPLAALAVSPPAHASAAVVLADYRPAFLVAGLGALVAGLIVLPVREERPAKAPNAARGAGGGRRGLAALLRPHLSPVTWRTLLKLSVANGVNGLAVGFFGPFITYWLYRRYGATPGQIGLLFAIINIAAMLANLAAARMATWLGLVNAIFWGRIIQAALMIPMVLAPTFWLAGAIYLLRMMAQRVALPLRQSYVMGVIPPAERGTAGALANLPTQVTSAISPIFSGYLFDAVSLELPFEVGAALQALSATIFFLFFRREPPPEERVETGQPEQPEQPKESLPSAP